jgi:hypothetical protein
MSSALAGSVSMLISGDGHQGEPRHDRAHGTADKRVARQPGDPSRPHLRHFPRSSVRRSGVESGHGARVSCGTGPTRATRSSLCSAKAPRAPIAATAVGSYAGPRNTRGVSAGIRAGQYCLDTGLVTQRPLRQALNSRRPDFLRAVGGCANLRRSITEQRSCSVASIRRSAMRRSSDETRQHSACT